MNQFLEQQTIPIHHDPVAIYRQLYRVKEHDEIPKYIQKIDISAIPEPDFPHAKHHVVTVFNFAEVIANSVGLTGRWRNALRDGSKYHDVAQGYTIDHLSPIASHTTSSAVICYMMTGNIDATQLVDHHDRDLLGQSFEMDDKHDLAQQILRDADRLAHMGHAGLVRAAYYWGFRHPFLDSPPDEVINDQIVCDPRCTSSGLPEDSEHLIRRFVFDEILPFLIKTNQLDRAINHVRTNFQRFFGSNRKEENFLYALRRNRRLINDVQSGKLKMLEIPPPHLTYAGIQSIGKQYQRLFIRKVHHDETILSVSQGIQNYIYFIEDPESLKQEINFVLSDAAKDNLSHRF